MADNIIRPPSDGKPIARTIKKASALPAGRTVETDPNGWYYLKANFRVQHLPADVWYVSRARTPARNPAHKDLVVFDWRTDLALQFCPQPVEEEPGWQVWKIKDDGSRSGTYLDCKGTDFLFSASGNGTWFRIIDDELYCGQWGTNVGYASTNPHDALYLLAAYKPFTCELVKAS